MASGQLVRPPDSGSSALCHEAVVARFDRDPNIYGIRAPESCRARREPLQLRQDDPDDQALVRPPAIGSWPLLHRGGRTGRSQNHRQRCDPRVPPDMSGVEDLAKSCVQADLYPGVPSRSLFWASCCSCHSYTPGSQSLPNVADGPMRGSSGAWPSRKACTYARSCSIRART